MKPLFNPKLISAAVVLALLPLGHTAFAQTAPAKAPSRGTVVVKASGTLAVNVGREVTQTQHLIAP